MKMYFVLVTAAVLCASSVYRAKRRKPLRTVHGVSRYPGWRGQWSRFGRRPKS